MSLFWLICKSNIFSDKKVNRVRRRLRKPIPGQYLYGETRRRNVTGVFPSGKMMVVKPIASNPEGLVEVKIRTLVNKVADLSLRLGGREHSERRNWSMVYSPKMK